MKQISEKVVFFGSGPVAAKSLMLFSKYSHIEAVITKPRRNEYQPDPPVFQIATKLKLPILYASNKTDLDSAFKENNFESKIGILIDFGIIISQEVIDKFKLGIINSHFSILPEWRGPDPITYSILSGQSDAGVSLMKLVLKMDEGPLLNFRSIKISPKINNNDLTDKLIELSNQLIIETLPLYIQGKIKLMDQSITRKSVCYSRMIKKEDGLIDFNKPAIEIERQIRAFKSWPKSKLLIKNKTLIITEAEFSEETGQPGRLFVNNNNELGLYCGKNSLIIKRLTPAGKKEMSSNDYLIGNKSILLI